MINPRLEARLELQERLREGRRPARDERERHGQILEREIMSRCAELFAHTSGAFGLEVRLPFMDVALIEYCLSLPSDQKMRRGFTRYVMRGGMKDILPEKIRWRGGKSDLGPSFGHGLRKFEAQRLEQILRDHTEVLEPYLDLGRLTDVVNRFRANLASDQDVSHLWKAASLALWLQPAKPVAHDLVHPERR